MAHARTGVSVVCVYNDPIVLANCLERSVERGRAAGAEVELVAIDNRDRRFPTAGAALNYGAGLAQHPVVAFAHQDVYLHSLAAVQDAAATLLDDGTIGLVGAVGITDSQTVSGVLRDRVVMIGVTPDELTRVDSVDEVAFLLRRADVLESGISQDPDLAWHAYAVEYCARVHSRGQRVVTANLAITHNSMTVNLHRLAEAHARIAELYPTMVPLQTTCGVVRATSQRSRLRSMVRRRHGLATWLFESRQARLLGHATAIPAGDVVLADIRLDIDDVLDLLDAADLMVLNVDPSATSTWDVEGLIRRERTVSARQITPSDVPAALESHAGRTAVLLTGRPGRWLAASHSVDPADLVVGFARDTGVWVLVAPGAASTLPLWRRWRERAVARRRTSLHPEPTDKRRP